MERRMRAKPANQGRSREKRDRILAAMDRLLRQKTFAEIGVADLAAEAGVSAATTRKPAPRFPGRLPVRRCSALDAKRNGPFRENRLASACRSTTRTRRRCGRRK